MILGSFKTQMSNFDGYEVVRAQKMLKWWDVLEPQINIGGQIAGVQLKILRMLGRFGTIDVYKSRVLTVIEVKTW